MITSRQVRAARALLGWTQEALADRALVALTALKRLEANRPLPVRDETREAVRRALERGGITFVTTGRKMGVLLDLPDTPEPGQETQ